MSLDDLLKENRIRRHKPTKSEIDKMLVLVRRDLTDMRKMPNVSADRRFATAYSAVLRLSNILLHCSGYRTRGQGHHETTFKAMEFILGHSYSTTSKYFDDCRNKRNISEYVGGGEITETEAKTLMKEAEAFFIVVKDWLTKNAPNMTT